MNILDRRFKYVNAASTDIKATFRRIERERKAKAEQEAAKAVNVIPVTRKKAG